MYLCTYKCTYAHTRTDTRRYIPSMHIVTGRGLPTTTHIKHRVYIYVGIINYLVWHYQCMGHCTCIYPHPYDVSARRLSFTNKWLDMLPWSPFISVWHNKLWIISMSAPGGVSKTLISPFKFHTKHLTHTWKYIIFNATLELLDLRAFLTPPPPRTTSWCSLLAVFVNHLPSVWSTFVLYF